MSIIVVLGAAGVSPFNKIFSSSGRVDWSNPQLCKQTLSTFGKVLRDSPPHIYWAAKQLPSAVCFSCGLIVKYNPLSVFLRNKFSK